MRGAIGSLVVYKILVCKEWIWFEKRWMNMAALGTSLGTRSENALECQRSIGKAKYPGTLSENTNFECQRSIGKTKSP